MKWRFDNDGSCICHTVVSAAAAAADLFHVHLKLEKNHHERKKQLICTP